MDKERLKELRATVTQMDNERIKELRATIDVLREECYVFNPLNLDRTIMINKALDVAIRELERVIKANVSDADIERLKALNIPEECEMHGTIQRVIALVESEEIK